MKISHVIYKANDLNKTIELFRGMGYNVEYGSKYNPHNALIYFSEGPYIELLEKSPVSFFQKLFLRLLGKSSIVKRFEIWDDVSEGFFEICLETKAAQFKKEETILRKNGKKYWITKSNRLDPYDRLLKWQLLFPYDEQIPFMMTYFSVDPKPTSDTHANGVKKIKSIVYGTQSKYVPILNELCNDDILKLYIGSGIKDVIFLKDS